MEIPSLSSDTRTILMTIGLPGSGKTVFCKQLLATEQSRWRRINRDDLRMMLWNSGWNGRNEDERIVTEVTETTLRSALAAGYDVVADNTFLSAKDRKAIHLIAEDVGDCIVIEKVIACPVEECLRRNALRSGPARVPDEVILAKAKQYHVAKDGSFKGIKDSVTEYRSEVCQRMAQDESLPPAIIVDLDGTLCLIGERNRYDASRCEEDGVNKAVLCVILNCCDNGLGHFNSLSNLIFMSGRSDKYRPETERWLKANLPQWLEYQLFMRAEGDMRKDSIVKRELFNKHVRGKYFVRFCLDDRSQVVRLWRSLGLTCFQVDEGNF